MSDILHHEFSTSDTKKNKQLSTNKQENKNGSNQMSARRLDNMEAGLLSQPVK